MKTVIRFKNPKAAVIIKEIKIIDYSINRIIELYLFNGKKICTQMT